ncbi:aldehyde dehydrogenase family protein [Streptomyces sp. NPDC048636]|uniref:aldehyde dehydrogenase family protein n=1 Tax=Streptomyces sp. NPDC048636 TaxID=3155762 RepID=UPI0034427B47
MEPTDVDAGQTSAVATADHLIDGRREAGERRREVRDPGDGSLVGTVAWGGASEAVRAVEAAERAFAGWSGRSGRERGDILREAADLLRSRIPELAPLLAREAGKRLPEAEGELAFSAEYLRWFAEEARRVPGSVLTPESPGRRHLVLSRPAGVAVSLTPWNFPVSIQARKIAPMLAAGCTVVARVAEGTPLAVTGLFRALADAGVPAGALNLVHGPARETTEALLSQPAVRVVSFTGSTPVGSAIMTAAARRIIRPLLELGGNAPFVVFADADLDAAIDGALLGRLRNTGQSCVAANRFLVHSAVADEFAHRLAERFDALSVGHGVPQGGPVPDLGPMISGERVAAVKGLVEAAVADGGQVLTKRTVSLRGAYLAPVLVDHVPVTSRLFTEEVFGPAAGVTRFEEDHQALTLARAGDYGLASYLYTRDAERAWRFAEQLDSGILGINDPLPSVTFAPMGGTMLSGLGREGGAAGMAEFLETRHVAWR